MRPSLVLPALLAAACGVAHDRPRDTASPAHGSASAAAVRDSVARFDSLSGSGEVTMEGGRPTPLAPNDPWLPAADSAIRRHLAGVLSGAAPSTEFGDCGDDDGSDNPTIGAVAVSARPIRRTEATYEPFGNGYPVRRATYEVEVTSAAVLVPDWIAKFPVDTTVRNAYQYEARIGARTDTLSVSILQRADSAGRGHWEACDPTGPALSEGDGPGFWFFDTVPTEPANGIRITHWVPAGATWARVRAVADSVRRAGIRD